jgi:hypothetical protein
MAMAMKAKQMNIKGQTERAQRECKRRKKYTIPTPTVMILSKYLFSHFVDKFNSNFNINTVVILSFKHHANNE